MIDCIDHGAKGDSFGYASTTSTVDGIRYPTRKHIVACCKAHGLSVADIRGKGIEVRHKCDNPRCINPEHLEFGSREDNMRDMVQRNRHKTPYKEGYDHALCKVTPKIVKRMRELHEAGVSMRKIGQQYGMAHTSVSKIVKGERYAD